jgi:hypothetical protein
MNRSIGAKVFAMAAFVLIAGAAQASGSDGASGAETGDAAAYNTGKGIFASRLACSGCKMAGKKLDAAEARTLLADKGNLGLNADEAQALAVYLQRRFKL